MCRLSLDGEGNRIPPESAGTVNLKFRVQFSIALAFPP